MLGRGIWSIRSSHPILALIKVSWLDGTRLYSLHVKQNSKIGNADAIVKILLKSVSDTETEISFDGDARLSGLLARTGNRVISGVATTLTKQFFNNFENELKTI